MNETTQYEVTNDFVQNVYLVNILSKCSFFFIYKFMEFLETTRFPEIAETLDWWHCFIICSLIFFLVVRALFAFYISEVRALFAPITYFLF